MQIRCTYCQTMFPISRDEMLAALQHMEQHQQKYYDAHCPKCRRANRVEGRRIEIFLPDWKKTIKVMEQEAAVEAKTVEKPVAAAVATPGVEIPVKPARKAHAKSALKAAAKPVAKAAAKPAAKAKAKVAKKAAAKPAAKAVKAAPRKAASRLTVKAVAKKPAAKTAKASPAKGKPSAAKKPAGKTAGKLKKK